MNMRDRFRAIMSFEEAGRVPTLEGGYWAATIRRWYREGLPMVQGIPDLPEGRGVMAVLAPDVEAYMGFDHWYEPMEVNTGVYPLFEEEILEEHGDWVLMRTTTGCIEKQRKDRMSIPVRVAGSVQSREDWEQLKAERLQPVLDGRLPENWDQRLAQYRDRDYLIGGISCEHWLTLVSFVGLERLLFMFHDDPELLRDMLNYMTDFWLALLDQLLPQVVPDICWVGGDFCYKTGPLMSPAAFREFFLPGFSALASIMRDYGVPAVAVHSDGDVRPLMPLFVESGVTGLHPFEVTNGQNIVEVRQAFPRFQIFGGLDKQAIAAGREATDRELEAKLPFMLRHGGYIPYVDHAVSPDISWQNFLYYRGRVREYIENAT